MSDASETLANMIDETVLKRRITVSFGSSDVEAKLLLAGRRLLKIDELSGIADKQKTVGEQLTQADSADDVRETLLQCLEQGAPKITAIEKSLAFDDPTMRGLSARDIFAAA